MALMVSTLLAAGCGSPGGTDGGSGGGAAGGAGRMTLIGHTPTGGNTPRSFAIDPAGTVLLVANQGSGTVTSFRIDVDAGTLASLGQSKPVNSPAFVGVVYLP